MDDIEYITILAEELIDTHPEKYQFATEKLEFCSWFVGRILFNPNFKFDRRLVESIVYDLISIK